MQTFKTAKNLTVKQLVKQEMKELSGNCSYFGIGTKVSALTEQQLNDIAEQIQHSVRESLKYIALNSK
jgi:hypothetical protein